MNYEDLLEEAKQEQLCVIDNIDFDSKAEGLIKGKVIGINKKVRSYKRRSCILAEELGHFHTTTGNILDQTSTANRKQEYKARLWSFNKLIGLNGIVSAYKAGCRTAHDVAEHLNITEEFLQEALSCYRQKYGIYTKVDNYVIYFEPGISVLELI